MRCVALPLTGAQPGYVRGLSRGHAMLGGQHQQAFAGAGRELLQRPQPGGVLLGEAVQLACGLAV